MGKVGALRVSAAGVGKAASAAERVGLESAETAANAVKADRIAAEASIATKSSPKVTITGTEPVKSLGEKEALERIKENVKNTYNLSEKSENNIYHKQLIKNAEFVPSTVKNNQSAHPRDINEKILF